LLFLLASQSKREKEYNGTHGGKKQGFLKGKE